MSGPLTDRQKRLLQLFRQAIERERAAQKLYAEMLYNCDDPDLKEIIESLKAEEHKHEEMLTDKYAALREK